MANLPEDVRNVTDPPDAVGNTTKAVTKGYAIGSAVLAALVLFAAFHEELREEAAKSHLAVVSFDISQLAVLVGLIVGGMMVYLFAALAIEAVGRAGRRGRRGAPPVQGEAGHHGPQREARLRTGGGHRDRIGAEGDDHSRADPDRGDHGGGHPVHRGARRLLIGVIVVGFFMAISMTAGGGAWDNAKKLIEDGEYGGKGSEAHAASVTGDTVGDPLKDTAGPAINPMIKVRTSWPSCSSRSWSSPRVPRNRPVTQSTHG